MIRFSARGDYLPLEPQGRVLIRDGALISFFEKQQNIQNKSLIRYKKGAKSNETLRGAKESAWRAHTFSQSLRDKKTYCKQSWPHGHGIASTRHFIQKRSSPSLRLAREVAGKTKGILFLSYLISIR